MTLLNQWRRDKSPPPTPPRNDFMNLGESWKGGETLVPILGDPSQKAFGMTLQVGSKGGLLTPSITEEISHFVRNDH